jgi:hypothetical protein
MHGDALTAGVALAWAVAMITLTNAVALRYLNRSRAVAPKGSDSYYLAKASLLVVRDAAQTLCTFLITYCEWLDEIQAPRAKKPREYVVRSGLRT